MKISKLFHWLYGAVMLLPLFAIGISCGYAMFNKNAYQSYSDNSVYENIKITESLFNNELKYTAIYNGGSWNSDNTQYTFTYLSLTADDLNITQAERDSLTKWNWLSTNRIQLRNSSGTLIATINFTNNGINQFEFIGNVSPQFYNGANLYQVVITNNKLSDVFYYSIDKVMESDVFSWSYDSFLVAPFTYIVTLFSMPTNSVIVMLLSYWLAISIIWLVFDLVMYVPLLVHRWIDKGVLE